MPVDFFSDPSICSGSIAYSPILSAILVHNLAFGFDLFEIRDDAIAFVRRFENFCQQGRNIQLPTLFLHGGTSVTGGSTCGGIKIWKRLDESRFLSLKLSGELEMPAIDIL